jgi:hypothetical protein
MTGHAVTAEEWRLLVRRSRSLRERSSRRFCGDASLCVRILPSLLTKEQAARLDELERARAWNENRVWIVETLTRIERRTPLDAEQRRKLRDLLLEAVKPQHLGAACVAEWNVGDFWTAFVRIPIASFRSIDGEADWPAIVQQISRDGARGIPQFEAP